MAGRGVLTSILLLRVFALLVLAASVLVMGFNNFTDDDGTKVKFTDLIAYRYVFASGAIGFIYTMIQIPFATYDVVKEKRFIRNDCLPEFDFYGDKVIAFLLASGVGVGYGVTCEFKRSFGQLMSDKVNKFMDIGGFASTSLLAAGFVLMALLSIASSTRRSSSSSASSKGFFK